MKIKCPVAGCDYIVKGADDGFKHFQNYDEFHKALHWNWIKYYYGSIANSDMPDTVKFRLAYKKWRMIAQAYIKQQKSLKKQYKHQEKPKKEERYGIEHFVK